LDCAAGLSRNVLDFGLAADRVLVVTTPEPPALTDAYATIKMLCRSSYEGGVSLLVNRAESRSSAAHTYERLAGVATKFLNYSVAYGGYMVHDTAVELAVHARCPFVIRSPSSNASACMAALAGEVARSCSAGAGTGGFFRRVAGLFV
jgi:flagellar biosynthesis protein FlhG